MIIKTFFRSVLIPAILIATFTACDKTYQHPCMTSSSGGIGLDDEDYKCCQNLQCEWITYQCKDVFGSSFEKCMLEAGIVVTVLSGMDFGVMATATTTICLADAEIKELDCEAKKKDKYSADFGACKVFEDGDIAAEKNDLTEEEMETCPLDTADVPDPYPESSSGVGSGSYGASDGAIGAAQTLLDGKSAVSTESPTPSAAQFANVPSVAAAIANDKKPSSLSKTGNDGAGLTLPTVSGGSSSGSSAGGSSGGLTSMGLTPQAAISAAAVEESKQLSESGSGYGSGGAGVSGASGYSSNGGAVIGSGGGASVTDLSRGPASGIETIIIEDPADYFTRTDLTDSIFKIVERRYRSESMKWMKEKSGL